MKPSPRSNTPKPGEKTLPVRLRFILPGELLFKPSLKHRLQILLGYAVRVKLQFLAQHNPGVFDSNAEFEVTPYTRTDRLRALEPVAPTSKTTPAPVATPQDPPSTNGVKP